MKKIIISALLVTGLAALLVKQRADAYDAYERDAPAQAVAKSAQDAQPAKAARIALKLKCVDLKYSHAKLSAADLKDLQTCKKLVDEDWAQALKELPGDRAQAAKAEAEQNARAAEERRYVCGRLRDTKIAELTLHDLAILNSCGY